MSRKKKNKYFIPLIAAVMIIWGVIGHKVFSYYFSNTKEQTEDYEIEPSEFSRLLEKKKFAGVTAIEYEKLNRNPFSFSYARPRSKPKKTEAVKAVPAPPIQKLNFSLNGVVVNPNSKMIILEDKTNNKTLFLHEGEKYEYIKIKTITASKITYWDNKELKEYLIR